MKKSRRTYNGVHLNKKSNTQDVVEQSLTEKHDSKNSPEKAGRSTIPFEVFAYLNSDYELISVDLKSTADVEVSVTSLFTNETILSDSYSTSTSEIILNLAGLLNEGEAYRIEITIGDTVLYGDFTY